MAFLAKFGSAYSMVISLLFLVFGVIVLVMGEYVWGIVLIVLGGILFFVYFKKLKSLRGKGVPQAPQQPQI